ncbi:protein phosphatase 1 regulatory subunit 36 isoform X2 [Leptinotarsa decemlineata]|uniref:protein phosphatase 1 regulatory subunit 36 isoform X2 n=1 Tax=Leptinotarsa decemlineata TaxID=7539 RepID=UPI000C254D04|nr:protein phosphatase 1 regulatory subunit 36-like isoform X2 [Leptinotarsa decemlineata]
MAYSRDQKDVNAAQRLFSGGSPKASINSSGINKYEAFKEAVGTHVQIKFRKHYQRKEKVTEKNIVILQDIKDVAIFLCNISLLTLEFISYFHTKAMDKFLRSLIIYFQYYFQVWNKMQLRRKEANRKLRQPLVTVLEDVIRDDLADLRSMVARDYAAILMGMGDAKEFHHLNKKNNVSLSDKDRRHFETIILLSERVVWIALRRRYLSLIEKEMNRLFRTDTFNPIEHDDLKTAVYKANPEEQRILKGKTCISERKLLQRSPAIQEIILENHDYKMLAIGVTDVGNLDERQQFLEAAYAAPEELLENLQIGIGILGKPRKFFDPFLKPMEISTTKKRGSVMKPIPEFVIPPRSAIRDQELPETLPRKPCRYSETKSSKEARKNQCKIWRQYVKSEGQVPTTTLELLSMTPSFMTLRTRSINETRKFSKT